MNGWRVAAISDKGCNGARPGVGGEFMVIVAAATRDGGITIRMVDGRESFPSDKVVAS